MKTSRLVIFVAGIIVVAGAVAQAQNLLTNGNFESVQPEFPGWNITEAVVGHPELTVDSIGQQDFANQPGVVAGQSGAWLKEFAGNVGTCCNLLNYQTTGTLSQTVAGTAGQQYTLSGWSLFQQNYSGGVDTLDGGSPSGAVASPTSTTFSMQFLNSLSQPIGAPVALDLKADRRIQSPIAFANDASWYQSTISATAPAGTANVQVVMGAKNMIANVDPSQSAFIDNFSLKGSGAPSTELLTNADLNTSPTSGPPLPGWTLTSNPTGNAALGGSFANNPASSGSHGYWLKAFATGDATLSQNINAVAGGDYTFTAQSAFGQDYSGGTSGAKPSTVTLLQLAFLDGSGNTIGTPVKLDLWDAGQRNATGGISIHPEAWQSHSIEGVAPANAVSAQVSIIATGMAATMDPDQGAFFDNLSLTLASAGLAGDYNHDGKVNAADYVAWRNGGSPTPNSLADYNTWRANFGNHSGSGTGLANTAVPEPMSWSLMLIGLVASGAFLACDRDSTETVN